MEPTDILNKNIINNLFLLNTFRNATFENLQFLTVEQIIVDISILIETTKDHLKSGNGSVILWGSGFGASLATWTKQTYPELVTGVWSSSGIYERSVISSGKLLLNEN